MRNKIKKKNYLPPCVTPLSEHNNAMLLMCGLGSGGPAAICKPGYAADCQYSCFAGSKPYISV